jgi:glycosyltransferase involved in cell wall biosynthesis
VTDQLRGPRVAHLAHTHARGGAEYALGRMLRAHPLWQPLVLVPPDRASEKPETFDIPGVRTLTYGVGQPAGVSAGGLSAVATGFARLVVQAACTRLHPAFRSADLVDANTARAAAYGALAARTSRIAFVVHLRDLVSADALGGFGFTMITRLVLPRANGVIANSRATLDSARPYLRSDAITAVIPSASGLTVGAAQPPPAHPPVRIGMLARIDPWKGQAELLEAFAAVTTEGAGDAILEFAGAPLFGHEDFEAELRTRAVELGIADRVRFLGHVDDVPALLAGWHVAVQYSTRPEPLGQNVLQYLAAGRAVIVAGEGGPVEWVTDDVNGLVVAPRDVGALAAVLQRSIADGDLRRRLGDAASVTPGLLDDAAVARAHREFYDAVLAKRGPRKRRPKLP